MASNFSGTLALGKNGIRAVSVDRRTAGAFAAIYRDHVAHVYGLCLRMTGQREAAEDCTQETFVAAWRALPQFAARSSLATWLHRIAVNQVLARGGGLAAKREVPATDEAIRRLHERSAGDAPPPIDLERAIAQLPDGPRHVLVLVGIYGYSHTEVGQMLKLAPGTSRAHLHRARHLLAERFGFERPAALEDES